MPTATPKPRNIYSRKSVKKFTSGNSLTVQSQAEDTKIQNIVKKYMHTGYLPTVKQQPQYLDTTGIGDLSTAIKKLKRAEDYFYTLDPKIRAQFNNDIPTMVNFIKDPNNLEQCYDLGLIKRPPVAPDPEPTTPSEPTTPTEPTE